MDSTLTNNKKFDSTIITSTINDSTIVNLTRRNSLFTFSKIKSKIKDKGKSKSKSKKSHELEMMYFLSDKIYGSTSWKKYVNETSPSLIQNLLDSEKYTNITYEKNTKEVDNLNNQQELNLKISDMFTNAYCKLKISSQINGWDYRRTEIARNWKNELSYLYSVNYYFMFSLKRRESKWSWILIVLSSVCSVLTIVNTNDVFIFELVRYTLSILALCTSLIAAFIKKENYVDRIKELDRYTQKVGKINTEINNVIKQKPWNRMEYSAFTDKYLNETNALLSAPPPMSPLEFKITVYNLTKYYPEIIVNIYPWYIKKKFGNVEYYEMTDWGERILISYSQFKICYCCKKLCICNPCCTSDNSNIFRRHKQHNDCILHTLHSEQSRIHNFAKQTIKKSIHPNYESDSENSTKIDNV